MRLSQDDFFLFFRFVFSRAIFGYFVCFVISRFDGFSFLVSFFFFFSFWFDSIFLGHLLLILPSVRVWNSDYGVMIDSNMFHHYRKTEKMIPPLRRWCQIQKGHLGPEVSAQHSLR